MNIDIMGYTACSRSSLCLTCMLKLWRHCKYGTIPEIYGTDVHEFPEELSPRVLSDEEIAV